MSKNSNTNVNNFVNYVSRPIVMSEIHNIYNSHHIIYERVDLYREFIITLNELIVSTYLGDDVTKYEDQINHYNWCWNRACVSMNFSQIIFNENSEAHKYFLNFYFDTFYSVDKEEEQININRFTELWSDIFNYNIEKPKSDIDTFLIVYRLFDKSYKKR